jgi:hypothetical protein
MQPSTKRFLLLVAGLGVVAAFGVIAAFKWIASQQRVRVEAAVSARIALGKEAAAFEKCFGDALRQARANDQRRREEAARTGRQDRHREEGVLWEKWRASGKSCPEAQRAAPVGAR